jgi:copper chaperone
MLRLKVTGMTCNHCIRSVTKAVQSVVPAADVDISLESGEVRVAGAGDGEQVIAAIADAGYDVEREAA